MPIKTVEDFILTISDNDEVSDENEAQSSVTKRKRSHRPSSSNRKRQKLAQNGLAQQGLTKQGYADSDAGSTASEMASDFEFEMEDDLQDLPVFDAWESGPSKEDDEELDVDAIIAKRRSKTVKATATATATNGRREVGEDGGEDEEVDEDEEEPWGGIDDSMGDDEELLAEDGFGMGADPSNELADDIEIDVSDEEEEAASNSEDQDPQSPAADSDAAEEPSEDEAEKIKAAAFFAPEEKQPNKVAKSFGSMFLSRAILRGLGAMQFHEPTPIQTQTIPVALMGKDIVGGAVTGSGKTAAYMIPILDRLMYRSKKVPTSRVAILLPTRELAVQCFAVGKKLASFTDITFCQLVGGFSLREQEQTLKKRPDVIIATPGRFIDHMRNSAGFTIDTLEILVLDEADKMLEDGFADELNEILTTIPRSRQTMLFSATMSSSIDRLVEVGLNQPVRIMVDAKKQTVTTLKQEFLRLRPQMEDKRLSYLLHLCKEVFTDRCIVFFRQKKEVHRVRIIFALLGFKVSELHGDMTQVQRISAVEKFRAGEVTHLLATDVAARGLDIKRVESVINYEAPQSHDIYLHRVGRTARAGRSGVSCTITTEADRKIVKAAIKVGKAQNAEIVRRTVEAHLIDTWSEKLEGIGSEVDEVLVEEKEQKELASAELQVKKGRNLIEHEAEIMARPQRTWFQSENDKKSAKQADPTSNSTRTKPWKRKLSGKEKKRIDLKKERAGGIGRGKSRAQRDTPGLKAGGRGKPSRKR